MAAGAGSVFKWIGYGLLGLVGLAVVGVGVGFVLGGLGLRSLARLPEVLTA